MGTDITAARRYGRLQQASSACCAIMVSRRLPSAEHFARPCRSEYRSRMQHLSTIRIPDEAIHLGQRHVLEPPAGKAFVYCTSVSPPVGVKEMRPDALRRQRHDAVRSVDDDTLNRSHDEFAAMVESRLVHIRMLTLVASRFVRD